MQNTMCHAHIKLYITGDPVLPLNDSLMIFVPFH